MATPPDFTAGAVLTAAQMNAVGLWLVKTQTIGTSVTTVTVTDAFSSDYDNYKIMISGGSGNISAAVKLQLGASTTGYYGGLQLISYAAAAELNLNDNNANGFSYAGSCSSTQISFNVDVINPALVARTIVMAGYVTPATGEYGGFYGGFHNVATAYTDFTLSGATFTAGTIRVYGYRN